MEIQDIAQKITAFLVDELEIEEEKISPEARLKEDLGIDSLEVVDVAVLVDKEFGFKMKPEEFRAAKTFGEFCNYISSRVNA